MSETYSTVVVGGGLAGATAALEAAEAGGRVALVTRAPGATALSSGCWDLGADPRWRAHHPLERLADPWAAVEALADEEPGHLWRTLFARIGGLERTRAFAEETLAALAERLPIAMAPGPMVLATDRGRAKPCAWAQASMAAGNLLAMRGARVLVVGIEGFADFHPETCAAQLRALADGPAKGRVGGVAVEYVAVPERGARLQWSAFALAHRLDDSAVLGRLIEALRALAERHGATHLALPAVLGAADGAGATERIARETGRAAFELVAHTPSVPGLRLHRAIEMALADAGVETIRGEAAEPIREDGRVQAIAVRGDGPERTVAARAFVLAAGKYVGGGIRKDRAFAEPLFDLPVFYRRRRLGEIDSARLLDAHPAGRHALLSAGVRVDEGMRPVGEDGRAVCANLFAAGHVLAGYDFARDRVGLAMAAMTGRLAGRAARAEAGNGEAA